MHHIICDGTSVSIIKKEIDNYYNNDNIQVLKLQFSDYALHIEDKKNNGLYEEQFKYYQEMFNEDYKTLTLPQKENIINYTDGNIKNTSVMISRIINKKLSNKIDEYVKCNNISKTSFFLSIYGYVLSKYSGQNNIYSSIISANRNSHYTENMIGMFVSTQPILLKYGEENIAFSDIIKDNMNKLIEIYNNQEISFSELISKLNLKNYVEIIKNIESFRNDIYKIEYISKEEKENIIEKFNEDSNKRDGENYYFEKFQEISEIYPEKNAIIYNDIKYSYGELNKMSNSLAYYLRNNIGTNRNDIIPIICDRTPYYIISTLAISKAGGAFLPIDVKLPIDRIKFILQEVKPKIILHCNSDKIIENLNDYNYKFYNLKEHSYDKWQNKLVNINQPDDTCYVLFTSGTTGKPKESFEKNENNENNCCIYNLLIQNDCINNALVLTNFTFDISHDEITFCLMHGLTMVLADDIIGNNINILSDYIIKNNVEFINTTPSRFKIFMENNEFRRALIKVKSIVFIGENLPINLCKEIHKYSKCKIYNGYGPTECTVICTIKEINEEIEDKITIGKPLCNYKLYILDKQMKPVPVGVEGEIFIGGYGVGKGYLNREELTRKTFIECPFNSGDKHDNIMYRTGDIGKWTEKGEIEFLGRIDFQVKINGQRLELSEIESVMKEIKEIEQAIIIDKKKENGEKYLVGYYINATGTKIDTQNIKDYLKRKLPMYMVPNYYMKIEEIPLLSNGKLDHKGLPEPNKKDIIIEKYIAPVNKIEQKICKIYSEVLNYQENEIGRMGDFFEYGGDSLNAIRISSRIEKELNIRINIKDIMEHPLVYELGELIEKFINDKNDINHQIEIIERHNAQEFPITSQQMG
eukprot:jgi/Orpsp1_1/1175194/evm.model.c7180000052964.1